MKREKDKLYVFDHSVRVDYEVSQTIGVQSRLHVFFQEYARIFCEVKIPKLDRRRQNNSEYFHTIQIRDVQKIGKAMLSHEDTWLSSLYSDRREREKIYAAEIGIKIEEIYLRRVWRLRNHFLHGGGLKIYWDYKCSGKHIWQSGEYWPIRDYRRVPDDRLGE